MAEECWVCYGIAKRRKGEDSMSKANFQRVLTLKLYEVLYEESDEEHGLSLAEIRESLTLRGYPCDLRTVRLALQALWNAGYDIQKEFKYPRNLYTLLDRPFDVAELQILADAVRSATCITEKKTGQLIDKLAHMAGQHNANVLEQKHRVYSVQKSHNENIFRFTDRLHQAIEADRQVSFYYLRNRSLRCETDGSPKQYLVSPVGTVFNDGFYYLVGESKDHPQRLISYRVDRMQQLEIAEFSRDLTELGRRFSKEQYNRRVFSMYAGMPTRVVFRIQPEWIDAVTDAFGPVVPPDPERDGWYRVEADVDISPTFFAWCCHFSHGFQIAGPEEVVAQMREHLEKILTQYKPIGSF